jgi:hypothetical protein
MRRTFVAVLSLITLLGALAPASALASSGPPPDVEPPMFQVQYMNRYPLGFAVTPAQALAIAKTSPKLQAIHRSHHPLHYKIDVWTENHYEIYFYFHGKLIADQVVWPNGKLGATYTGGLILGLYARGHYGQSFDSPWVLVPFTLMFLLGLALLRRRSWLDRLDIAVFLTFGVSYALFDTGHLESAVWMFYPPLAYLLVRMLMRGFRARSENRVLDVRLPTPLLVLGLLALVAGRIAVTLIPPHVVDVGTASALGAYRLLHGQSLYYFSLGHPDTYGPLAYLAYAPFVAVFHGSWQYLASARAAAIAFDLLTVAALVVLGRRLRHGREGWRLGLLLAWLFAACPFSVLGMSKSTNDGLVALVVVLSMLALSSPIKRGILIGIGAASKFFPAALLPLVAVGPGTEERSTIRKVLAAFVIAAGGAFAVFMPAGGVKELWDHTIGFQLTRTDVFSIWALHPSLAPIKVFFELGAVALAVLVALRPRGPRTLAQVSALAAAVTVALQLPALHWFYLYIPWFLPLVLIAVLAVEAPAADTPTALDEPGEREFETDTPPALAGVA